MNWEFETYELGADPLDEDRERAYWSLDNFDLMDFCEYGNDFDLFL